MMDCESELLCQAAVKWRGILFDWMMMRGTAADALDSCGERNGFALIRVVFAALVVAHVLRARGETRCLRSSV